MHVPLPKTHIKSHVDRRLAAQVRLRRRAGLLGVRLGEAAHPGPGKRKGRRLYSAEELAAKDAAKAKKARQADLIRPRFAFAPAGCGHGVWTWRHGSLRFDEYAPVAATGPVAGLGNRVAHLQAPGRGLCSVSAGAETAITAHVSGAAADLAPLGVAWATDEDGPARTSLAYLRNTMPNEHGVPAENRLAPFISLCCFVGDVLPGPAHRLPVIHERGTTLDAMLRASVVARPTARQRLDLTISAQISFERKPQWVGATTPDLLVSPLGSGVRGPVECVLWYAIVIFYVLSGQQGKSVDSEAAALEAMVCGAVACIVREARRRQYAADPQPDVPPEGLGRPVLVVLLPTAWEKVTRASDSAKSKCARAFSFEWRPSSGDIGVRRSRQLTIGEALDYAFSAVC